MTLNLRVSTPEDVEAYELRNGMRAVIVADLRDYEDMFRDIDWIRTKPFRGFVINDKGGFYNFKSWTPRGDYFSESSTDSDFDIIRVYNKDCKRKQDVTREINDLIAKLKALKGKI